MEQNNERILYIKLEASLYESGLSLKKFSIGKKKENAICMCFNKEQDKNLYTIFYYEQNKMFDEIVMDDKEAAFHYFAYKITSSVHDKQSVEKILTETYLNDQLDLAYSIIIEKTNEKLKDNGCYKTSRHYEEFLKKVVLRDINNKLENFKFELEDLDLYYKEVLNNFRIIFNELLNKINKNRINSKLIKVLIPSIHLVYFAYTEEEKKYNNIKQKLENNENVGEYKNAKFDTLKDFVNQKLTSR